MHPTEFCPAQSRVTARPSKVVCCGKYVSVLTGQPGLGQVAHPPVKQARQVRSSGTYQTPCLVEAYSDELTFRQGLVLKVRASDCLEWKLEPVEGLIDGRKDPVGEQVLGCGACGEECVF